jgi:uncharacterized protein (TIGR04255 family)
MSKIRKLKRPPIKEAVIDFQFQPYFDFNETILFELKEKLKENYNKFEFTETQQITFGFIPEKNFEVFNSPKELNGMVLRDENRGFIFQLSRERLSLSKINSYNNFDELSDEFFMIFNYFNDLIKTKNISRIGVRYINEITPKNISKEKVQEIIHKKYLPDFNNCNRTFSQIMISDKEYEGAILNLVVDYNSNQIIIDIDCFNTQINTIDNLDTLKKILQNQRKMKNQIFFMIVKNKFEEVL